MRTGGACSGRRGRRFWPPPSWLPRSRGAGSPTARPRPGISASDRAMRASRQRRPEPWTAAGAPATCHGSLRPATWTGRLTWPPRATRCGARECRLWRPPRAWRPGRTCRRRSYVTTGHAWWPRRPGGPSIPAASARAVALAASALSRCRAAFFARVAAVVIVVATMGCLILKPRIQSLVPRRERCHAIAMK